MANLTPTEKRVFERIFAMSGGYVCDFSNRPFQEYVLDVTGINIDQPQYAEGGASKANRLRSFWRTEGNDIVATLLEQMLGYEARVVFDRDETAESLSELRTRAAKVIARLREGTDVEDIDVFHGAQEDARFAVLARQIQESVDSGRPEEALDRLHTYLTRYARSLCDRHSIEYNKKTPLNGLFGAYVRFLRKSGLVEAKATFEILSSSVKILDDLNSVRNDHSLAHDNELLDRNEATLIFRNVSSSVKFVKGLEQRIREQSGEDTAGWSDPEFTVEEVEAAGDQWMQTQADLERGR